VVRIHGFEQGNTLGIGWLGCRRPWALIVEPSPHEIATFGIRSLSDLTDEELAALKADAKLLQQGTRH
jgi:hypothetical protein